MTMSDDASIERLLRWRLGRAEAEAPPAPRAAFLLDHVRPWWDTWPERFRSQVERLGRIRLTYGYAMAGQSGGAERTGHPVATLIARADDVAEDVETYAHVLYLHVRDGRVRIRFQLDAGVGRMEQALEATFIADALDRPLFSCHAALSPGGEYRLDAELPSELGESWTMLKVTDRMPFRLILRPVAGGV
jgi:hypothetical protein